MKIGIIIVIVIAVGTGGYFLLGGGTDSPSSESPSMDGSDKRATLASLFDRGDDAQCTFTYADDFGSQEGMVYVSGQNVRGDFTLTANDGAVTTSHIINNATHHYNWGNASGETIGYQMERKAFNASPGDSVPADQSSAGTNLDYNTAYDFDCSPWSVDATKFEVPTDITFTDLGETLQQLQNVSLIPGADQCGTCDLIPDEAAKQTCRENLGC